MCMTSDLHAGRQRIISVEQLIDTNGNEALHVRRI